MSPLHPKQGVRGFTLVELLVVIVIISIMLGYLVVSIGSDGPDKLLKNEANRISTLIQMASEQALLQRNELGLYIGEEQYQFFQLRDGEWAPLSDIIFRERTPSESIQLELITVNAAPPPEIEEEDKIIPQIFLLSSGEVTPFELEIKDDGLEEYYTLIGTETGDITLKLNALF